MAKTLNGSTNQVGQAFVQRHQADIIGVLHGWDRLRLQGTLRSLYHPSVMDYYLKQSGVLWKDFKTFVTGLTDRVRQSAAALAIEHRRPMIYLPSSRTSKEDAARQIQERDKVDSGLIAVFSCVEPCRRWIARGNRATQKLELRLEWGKCIHLYFYWLHEQLGFVHLRLQSWFPFLIQVCLNGREWLAHQMDGAGIAYRREDNCFPWIADVAGAQALMEQQQRTHWPSLLDPLVQKCHPLCAEITRPIEREYYWTAAESEYATDVMFGEREKLERIYPSLVHHAVMSFGSEQVLRFLGHSGRTPLNGEVKSDRRRRTEGVRVKHWVNQNSVKCYDKDSILRVEATINDPKDFRVWRGPENNPEGKKQWRPLRRSVADLYRRAEVSRAATDRYLTALAAVHVSTALAEQAASLCRPVLRCDRRRYRALNPLGDADAQLLAIVNRGEYALNGFRNRDVRAHLYNATEERGEHRRQMTAVGRQLRLLRAHGLIAKVSTTHRYVVTETGRNVITAVLAARHASTEKLTALAA
jgi:hypothetical protein